MLLCNLHPTDAVGGVFSVLDGKVLARSPARAREILSVNQIFHFHGRGDRSIHNEVWRAPSRIGGSVGRIGAAAVFESNHSNMTPKRVESYVGWITSVTGAPRYRTVHQLTVLGLWNRII